LSANWQSSRRVGHIGSLALASHLNAHVFNFPPDEFEVWHLSNLLKGKDAFKNE
jgi:hypothetical protein